MKKTMHENNINVNERIFLKNQNNYKKIMKQTYEQAKEENHFIHEKNLCNNCKC